MCIKCSSFLIFSSLFKNTIRGTSRAAKGYRELHLSPSHCSDTGQTWSHSNHLSPWEICSQNSGWFLLLMFVCFYLTRLPTIRFFFYLIFFSDLSVPQLTTTVNASTSTDGWCFTMSWRPPEPWPPAICYLFHFFDTFFEAPFMSNFYFRMELLNAVSLVLFNFTF